MDRNGISRATMGRLPGYLHYIHSLKESDTRYVSATAVARALCLGEVQVRKDLSAVCGSGKPKVGYAVADLCAALERALLVNAPCEAVIVGAGKLGMALLAFGGFAEYGITVARAFDTDGRKVSPSVRPMTELPDYCRDKKVEIGILAVPPEAAQEAAQSLVESGVRAVWCFAPTRLDLPAGVTVQYENLALSLAHLHHRVHSAQKEGDAS